MAYPPCFFLSSFSLTHCIFFLLLFHPVLALPHRHLSSLVPSTPLILTYHNGPLLADVHGLDIYLLWYGTFSPPQKSIVTNFIASFPANKRLPSPSVMSWWNITSSYIDKYNAKVASAVTLAGEVHDAAYSLGKNLKRNDIQSLVLKSFHGSSLRNSYHALYMVLTAADVYVDGFCMNSCGFHDYTFPSASSLYRMVPFAWVGNSATQCPGQCAWPFAVPEFGPPNPPLLSPNGDVGMDGMIINVATILAGAATNPFGTGYFEGDSSDPSEAATACAGSFGPGSYPGYPGQLLVDKKTGASYNTNGLHGRKYLLPAVWNPNSLSCLTSS